MKKNIIKIVAGVFITVTMSNNLTAGAAIYAPSEHFFNMKNFLLLGNSVSEMSNYKYDINNDSARNVLDLCRMKRYSLNNSENTMLDSLSTTVSSFSLGNGKVDNKNRKVTFPVNIVNNAGNPEYFQMDLNFDSSSFQFGEISGGMSDRMSITVSGQTIKCSVESPVTDSGLLFNVELLMKDEIKNGTYNFVLSNLQISDKYGSLGSGRLNANNSEKSVKLSGVQNMFPADIPDASADPSKVQILNWVNSERSKEGMAPLTLDSKLSYVADLRAQELSVRNETAVRPDGSSYTSLLSEYGLLTSRYIQMVCYCYSASDYTSTMIQYRSKLLDKEINIVGVGHYRNGDNNYWVVYLTA